MGFNACCEAAADPVTMPTTSLPRNGTWRSFTAADGLAGLQVESIAQDADGFLWFACLGGLSRFDGDTFTNYDSRNGLSTDHAFQVYCDRRARLWVVTSDGVLGYISTDALQSIRGHFIGIPLIFRKPVVVDDTKDDFPAIKLVSPRWDPDQEGNITINAKGFLIIQGTLEIWSPLQSFRVNGDNIEVKDSGEFSAPLYVNTSPYRVDIVAVFSSGRMERLSFDLIVR